MNAEPFARTTLPMNVGEKTVLRQTAKDETATAARAPGRSSSIVKARPAASETPSVLK